MNRGAEKESAVASVSGRCDTAMKPPIMPVSPISARVTCAPGRVVRSTPNPLVRWM